MPYSFSESQKTQKTQKHMEKKDIPFFHENTKHKIRGDIQRIFKHKDTKTQRLRRHRKFWTENTTHIANRHTLKYCWLRTQKHKYRRNTELFWTENTTHTWQTDILVNILTENTKTQGKSCVYVINSIFLDLLLVSSDVSIYFVNIPVQCSS